MQIVHNTINIFNEAMYMMLAGYSNHIITSSDTSLETKPYKMATEMRKEFSKKRKLFGNKTAELIISLLKEFDKVLKDKSTSPSIMLILTLDYLFNIIEHNRTKMLFGHYRSDVKKLYFEINENKQYSKTLDEHLKIIEEFEKILTKEVEYV